MFTIITWLTITPNPTDTKTLIPFLKDMEQNLGFKYTEIVADAGYESEENYLFIEANGQTAFIKPNNYEISKKRRFKTDIGKMENMDYIKRIALKAIIARHQWNSVIKHCMFQKP